VPATSIHDFANSGVRNMDLDGGLDMDTSSAVAVIERKDFFIGVWIVKAFAVSERSESASDNFMFLFFCWNYVSVVA